MSTMEALLGGGASRRVSIDDALAEHAGEFGRWQLRHFVLVSAAWALEALNTMVIIFADRGPAMACPAGDGQCGDPCAGAAAGWVWTQGTGSSTVAEWGLVCGERYKVGLVQALFFAGCLIGFSNGSVGFCSFVLANEPIGPSRRGVAGMSGFYFFSGGVVVLAGVAAIFQSSWRLLYVVASLASLVYLVAVLPFVSESPRCRIPDGVTLKFDDNDDKLAGESSSASILDVLRSRTTRRRLVLSVLINLLCAVVYYGLSLNVGNLRTNLYVSVAVNALAEMPAFLLTTLFIDRFGRKPLAISTLLLSGVFCTAGSLISAADAMSVAKMACSVVGIFGMAATYNLLFIYTSELFTVVRNAALGCTGQATRMGAILAPLVVVLGERVPFAVFGMAGIVSGLLVFYLPETVNKPLYDTMAGLEEGEKTPCK
ncbi:hypothetical protein ACQ4PT_030576 [Festuca glaucescens]